MIFRLYNENCYDDDKKPTECIPCFKKKYDYVEIRTCSSFAEFDEKFANEEGNWLSKGTNHRINEKGYVERTFKDGATGWFVDLNSIDELVELTKKLNSSIRIVKDYCNNEDVMMIEFSSDK